MRLRASIWEAATRILNVTPLKMAGMSEAKQFKLLYDCLKEIPLCDIDFRVTNGDISIQEVELVSSSSTLPQWRFWKSSYGTPRRQQVYSEFGTPEKPPVSCLGTSSTPTPCNGFVTPTKQLTATTASSSSGEISVTTGSSHAVEKPRGLSSVARDLSGALSIAVRDLSSIVKSDDIVSSEQLTTLLVVVGKYSQKDLLSSYESLSTFVVPRSSKKVYEDNEYALYTVILLKKVGIIFGSKYFVLLPLKMLRYKLWVHRDPHISWNGLISWIRESMPPFSFSNFRDHCSILVFS